MRHLLLLAAAVVLLGSCENDYSYRTILDSRPDIHDVVECVFEETEEGTAAFRGEVSLENGGGFASVRCDFTPRNLGFWRGLALRVRGDGRAYKLRLRDHVAAGGADYQARFGTVPGAWITVRLPFESFAPTSRGKPVPGAGPLDLASVTTIGLLVSEQQAGCFELELGWIGAYGAR